MTDEKVDAFMPLWIGAYLADTLKFTTQQHGAYLLLLMAYWRDREPLQDDDDELRSIAKVDKPEWRKLRPVLARKFRVADGVWWHKRVEQELADALKRKAGAVSKAVKAAEARWGKSSGDAPSIAPSIAQAVPEDCPTSTPTPSSLRSDSDPDGSDAGGVGTPTPPSPEPRAKLTDPDEIIFGYGVPLLTIAGSSDKHARSFLAGLRKGHGDAPLIDALRRCVREKPLRPLEWLAAALPPTASKGKQSAVEARNASVVDELIGDAA